MRRDAIGVAAGLAMVDETCMGRFAILFKDGSVGILATGCVGCGWGRVLFLLPGFICRSEGMRKSVAWVDSHVTIAGVKV